VKEVKRARNLIKGLVKMNNKTFVVAVEGRNAGTCLRVCLGQHVGNGDEIEINK
jgi:hypothetical protein